MILIVMVLLQVVLHLTRETIDLTAHTWMGRALNQRPLNMQELRYIIIEESQQIEKDGAAYQDQEDPRTNLDGSHMRLEPPEQGICLIDSESQEQEGETHPQRIGTQEQHPFLQGGGIGCQDKNRTKQKADTGGPAKREDRTNQQ